MSRIALGLLAMFFIAGAFLVTDDKIIGTASVFVAAICLICAFSRESDDVHPHHP